METRQRYRNILVKTMFYLVLLGFVSITIEAVIALPGIEKDFTRNESRIENLTEIKNGEMVVRPDNNVNIPIRPEQGEKAGIRCFYGNINRCYHVLEVDPWIGMKFKPVNNNLTGNHELHFMVFEETRRYLYRDVPVTFCVNGTMPIGRFKKVDSSPWCDGSFEHIYEMDRLTFDTRRIITLPETPTTWQVWFGGDDLVGVSPQGFGDGLPTCTYITAQISINQTQTYVGNEFTFKIKAAPENGYPGCSLTSLEAQNRNDVPAWKVISTANVTNSNLICNSASCIQNPASFNIWYTKTVECKSPGNRTLRTRAFGSPGNANSPTKNMECLPLPSTNEPPTISTNFTNNSIWNDTNNIPFYFNYSDTDGNLEFGYLYINGTINQTVNISGTTDNHTFTQQFPAGTYWMRGNVTDEESEYNYTLQYYFTVNNTGSNEESEFL